MNIHSSGYAKSKVFYQVEIVSNIFLNPYPVNLKWLEKSCKFISKKKKVGRTFSSWIH